MHPSYINPHAESRKSPESRSGGVVDAIAFEDTDEYLIREISDVGALPDSCSELEIRVDDAPASPGKSAEINFAGESEAIHGLRFCVVACNVRGRIGELKILG